jgi:hypothetical protein
VVGRGCFGVPLVLNAGRRDTLRFAVWTRDLGFVRCRRRSVYISSCMDCTGAGHGIYLARGGCGYVLWRTEERGGLFAQKPKVNLDLQTFRGTFLCF